jgi:hypothetical protein
MLAHLQVRFPEIGGSGRFERHCFKFASPIGLFFRMYDNDIEEEIRNEFNMATTENYYKEFPDEIDRQRLIVERSAGFAEGEPGGEAGGGKKKNLEMANSLLIGAKFSVKKIAALTKLEKDEGANLKAGLEMAE